MGFQFQTDGKRTEEEEDFRQSDHTGAKTSDNEKHLWRDGVGGAGSRRFRNRLECMQEAWMGGPAADDKSIQKDR